ncbi:ATP synthase subunits region orf 7 [Fusarium oxysporum f. sp. phaseoli]
MSLVAEARMRPLQCPEPPWLQGGTGCQWNLQFQTTKTTNIVTGLCRLDMGTHGNFRLRSEITKIQQKVGYTWEVGTWSDINLLDASYSVLSFEKDDQRVQTGHTEWKYLPGGKSRSTYRRFTKPFKNIPEVVVFITGFDTRQGRNIRIDVSASNIDRNRFTVNMGTWAGVRKNASEAPVGLDSPCVNQSLGAIPGQLRGVTISAGPSVAEYGDLQVDSSGSMGSSYKRAYSYIEDNGK